MNRWWLALGYLLASVLAPCAHDHSGGSDDVRTRHEAGCDDERLHVSGHPSADLGHHSVDCPGCQFRSSHHAWQFTPLTFFQPSQSVQVDSPSNHAPSRTLRHFSSRAPPHA